jgi:hypothetical protein
MIQMYSDITYPLLLTDMGKKKILNWSIGASCVTTRAIYSTEYLPLNPQLE